MFQYKVRDTNNRLIASQVEAETINAVREMMRRKGFTVVEITEIKAKQGGLAFLEKKPTVKDVALFARQLSTLISSGVPLVQALTVMSRQIENPKFSRVVNKIRNEVQSGTALSDALVEHKVFGRLFVNLVRAGEVSGNLDLVLNRLSGFLEKDLALRGKLKSSMTYPTIVIVFAFGITYFLLTTIVPQFGGIISQLGGEMPVLTKILMSVSDFLKTKTWMFLIFGAVFTVAYKQAYKTPNGRRAIDTFKLRMPVMGPIVSKGGIATYARTLSLLMASGVQIIESLEITKTTMTNSVLEDAIENSRRAVMIGENMSDALAATKIFPPMTTQMMSIGEETGNIDGMLDKIADYFEREVDEAIDGMTAAIEPILIMVLGSIVGLIVAGMFMPMFAIIGQLSA